MKAQTQARERHRPRSYVDGGLWPIFLWIRLKIGPGTHCLHMRLIITWRWGRKHHQKDDAIILRRSILNLELTTDQLADEASICHDMGANCAW